MALATGTRLGPYEILRAIGAGGMGEVYRARDTKLDRDVALKILPEAFAADPERDARFGREARVLAALNHPNIASIYGLEESVADAGGARVCRALVLELVEGPTLADRIARGPIPLDEALLIGRQIAEALEAAHEKGVIHRDLKPANIKFTANNRVKVLDFGLAKLLDPSDPSAVVDSPTITANATRAGVILGTAAYMSPEQARGKPLDKRTDVWSFGCVLYEMICGTRVFVGDDVTTTIAAVVRAEPDWRLLPAGTPPPIRRLLRRALEKDPTERLPDIAAARLEIRDAVGGAGADRDGAGAVPQRSHERLAWTVAALLGAATLTAVWIAVAASRTASPANPATYRSSLIAPPIRVPGPAAIALSRDGKRLAYIAGSDKGEPQIWVRALDDLVFKPLSGTEGASAPFWSWDGQSIAFFAGDKLKRIAASGGSVSTICDAERGAQAGSWNQNDVILFALFHSPIQRVSAKGPTPSSVTVLDPSNAEIGHDGPVFLPDGRHFLFRAVSGPATRGVFVGSLDSPDRPRLLENASNALAAAGFLLFVRDGAILAQRFDPDRLELSGELVRLVDEIGVSPGGTASYAASDSGLLVYRNFGGSSRRLAWVGRDGVELESAGKPANYWDVQLSPDSARAAFSIGSGPNRDIWILDLARGGFSPVTSGPGLKYTQAWSPTGDRLAFAASRGGPLQLYQKTLTGSGQEDLLVEDTSEKQAHSWSSDGQSLLYVGSGNKTAQDLWILPMTGDRKPWVFAGTPAVENYGQFSHDGHWIAYQTNESGRTEVAVKPFPGPGPSVPVSSAGGRQPRWRRGAQELFYIAGDGVLTSVEWRANGGRFEIGAVRPLFKTPPWEGRWQYDVHVDGQRFLMGFENPEDLAPPLTLVVNWPALLGK